MAAHDIQSADPTFLQRVASDLKARSKTLIEMAEAGTFYFSDTMEYEPALADQYLDTEGLRYLSILAASLATLEDYTKEGIEGLLKQIADNNGTKMKNVAQPIRVALTGKTVSPGIDEVMITLGRDRVLKRLKAAIDHRIGT